MKVGIKFYSTDIDSISEARRLKKQGFFDYVELYSIPHSYEKTIDNWKAFSVPFVIHAPHSFHGFNLAQANMWETNQRNFKEAQLFADALGSDTIIIHGGNNGSFTETLRQISLLDENRIALENKPKYGLRDEVCVGWSPSEFLLAVDTGFLNAFVLDFVHAVCVANSLVVDVMRIVNEFMRFSPNIFHLSDGDISSERDIHLNLGKGNLNTAEFISIVPEGGLLTIETPRNPTNGLVDFVNDVCFLREILSHNENSNNSQIKE